MKATLLGLCAVLAASTVHAQDIAGPTLQPGLWETSVIRQERDGKDVYADTQARTKAVQEQARARMTPEQRKELATKEAKMFDPATGRFRQCFGPETGKKYFAPNPFLRPRPGCAQPKVVVDSGGDRTTYEMSCEGEAGMAKMTKIIATDDLVTISSEAYTTGADGARHTSMSAAIQMRFIGSDCGGLKSEEQVRQENLSDLKSMAHEMKKALSKMKEEEAEARKAAQREEPK